MDVIVTRADAILTRREPLTVGMSKAVPVALKLSQDWDSLNKVAIFRAGQTQIDVLDSVWQEADTVLVPNEVTAEVGVEVMFGIYGTDTENRIILPTVWVSLGRVQTAPDPSGDPSTDPALPVWAQLQGQLIDDAEVNSDGHLIITLHSGDTIDAGGVKGEDGSPGVGVPDGGSVGDILMKTGSSDYQTEWTAFDDLTTQEIQGIIDEATGADPGQPRHLDTLPAGGTTGMILAKASDDNYDTEWVNPPESGGGGGTSDYTDLSNKPSINGVTLSGNKTATQLGLGTYSKPSGGIPSSDLASAVQTSLGKADTAYQKPSGGIPAADLAAGVIPTVPTKVSDLTNDSGFVNAAGAAAAAPVQSINGRTGAVSLAIPSSAADVGAIAAPSSPSVGDFLVYTANGWAAAALPLYNGGVS